MIYGESGCGKTFFVLDICLAIAKGSDWKGNKVKEAGRVAYIAAEGAMGFRQRLKAHTIHYGVPLDDLPFYLIEDAPDLHQNDHKELIQAIKSQGGADV